MPRRMGEPGADRRPVGITPCGGRRHLRLTAGIQAKPCAVRPGVAQHRPERRRLTQLTAGQTVAAHHHL